MKQKSESEKIEALKAKHYKELSQVKDEMLLKQKRIAELENDLYYSGVCFRNAQRQVEDLKRALIYLEPDSSEKWKKVEAKDPELSLQAVKTMNKTQLVKIAFDINTPEDISQAAIKRLAMISDNKTS